MVRSDSCVLAGEGPLPKLSIVIPVYNERYLVGELHDLGNLIRGKPYMAAARRGLGMIAAARQPH